MPELARWLTGALALTLAAIAHADEQSVCFGTTSDGRLENGWKLPSHGENFRAYSSLARALGRTYVHSTVHDVLLDAYGRVASQAGDRIFVYGETGRRAGGPFKPHKTHRNGLSVDFMVPVIDADGRSVPLPTSVFNRWGYDLEFDRNGRLNELTIDATAMAEHLFHLHQAAERAGIGIWRVIFDPQLQPLLHRTERWPYLEQHLTFSTRRSWVRHDEHYHVDFDVPCRPLN